MEDELDDMARSNSPLSFLLTPNLPLSEELYESALESPAAQSHKRRRLECDLQADHVRCYEQLLSSSSVMAMNPDSISTTSVTDHDQFSSKDDQNYPEYGTEGSFRNSSIGQGSMGKHFVESTESLASNYSLDVVFLPVEGQHSESGKKYNHVAELVKLEEGTLKLFVERGRVVETQISYRIVNQQATLPTKSHSEFKLRFLPFSRCGSVINPVVGFRGPMQKKTYNIPEQLCFIQVIPETEDDAPQYQTDCKGFRFMDIRMNGQCGLYQLVFPFLNSQCPTAYRKDVWIRVSLIDSMENELCCKEFQVVCCTSPARDCNRLIKRHPFCVQKKHNPKTEVTPCIDWNSDRRSHSVWSSGTDTDVSPLSVELLSNCSPLNEDQPPSLKTGSILPVGCLEFSNASTPSQYEALRLSLSSNSRNSIKNPSSITESPSKQATNQPTIKAKCWNKQSDGMASAKDEYVVKTKNPRIYQILLNLERELSAAFENVNDQLQELPKQTL